MHNRKSSGPDVLRFISKVNPAILLDDYNSRVSEGIFYSISKVAQLVFFPPPFHAGQSAEKDSLEMIYAM